MPFVVGKKETIGASYERWLRENAALHPAITFAQIPVSFHLVLFEISLTVLCMIRLVVDMPSLGELEFKIIDRIILSTFTIYRERGEH